ncbi:MAG: peptide chain release factor N(5)-glutamine methyltransferase [Ignavibacteriota bacterium]
MNWEQTIHTGQGVLESAGISEARTNAEFLALAVLGSWSRAELRAILTAEPTTIQKTLFDSYISRRSSHQPLQHIIGETEFFGLRFFVSPAALIPRPDTEILVEEVLKEVSLMPSSELTILDVGTGSGIIPLALASQLPDATIIGIDISEAAINLSMRNKQRLESENVSFFVMNVLGDEVITEYKSKIDILASNPPYLSIDELALVDSEVRDFDPRIALTDGADGFRFYHRLSEIGRLLLRPRGKIIVEIGFGMSAEVRRIFENSGYHVARVVSDLLGIERVIVLLIDQPH